MTMTEPQENHTPFEPEPPSVRRAVLNQKRALILGAALVVAALWISIPMGYPAIGGFIAVGVLLGTLNHLMTEYQVQKAFASPDPVTREAYAKASLARLGLVSLLAFGIAAAFWRDGAATFFGLAIFQMIALTFTAFPLLREVRSHDSDH